MPVRDGAEEPPGPGCTVAEYRAGVGVEIDRSRVSAQRVICFSYVRSTPVMDMISTTTPAVTPVEICSQKSRVRNSFMTVKGSPLSPELR
jgi:hypothetical protein